MRRRAVSRTNGKCAALFFPARISRAQGTRPCRASRLPRFIHHSSFIIHHWNRGLAQSLEDSDFFWTFPAEADLAGLSAEDPDFFPSPEDPPEDEELFSASALRLYSAER